MKNTVQPNTNNSFALHTLLSSFRNYLQSLKLSSTTRKLYLSDLTRFLSNQTNLSEATLSDSKLYLDYLKQDQFTVATTLSRRFLATLKHFGNFLSQSYNLPNPTINLTLSSQNVDIESNNNLSLASSKYIKHFLNYLNSLQLGNQSIKSYKSDVNQFLRYLESTTPSTHITTLLSKENLQKYIDRQNQLSDKSPSTISRQTKTINRFLSWIDSTLPHPQLTDNTNNTAEQINTSPVSRNDQPTVTNLSSTNLNPLNNNQGVPDVESTFVKKNNYRKINFPFRWQPSIRSILAIALMAIFSATLGILTYRQFSSRATLTAAFPSTPITPNRQLSFQGRLENSGGTPITTATNLVFKLYDNSSGGTELYSSGTCSITPDTDGVFSTQIGSSCGSGIASSVFTENADVWLEVTVASETLTPRQQIATVAYALNAETIQGIPISATMSAIANTVVPMNQWGEIIVGEQSPRLTGVSGTFQISAPTLSLTTTTGSSGNITLAPDGTGQVNVNGNTTTTNFFNVSNAQLNTGSLITGTVANNNTGFKLIDLLSGSSPSSVFSVDYAGNTTLGGTLTLPNSNTLTGVTNYTQFSQGISVGGGTTYYINSSGNANLADLTLSGTLDANGQVDLGDGGDTITLNGSSITLTGLNCSTYDNGGALTTDGSGVITCSNDDGGGGSGTSYWRLTDGALSPVNNTLDVLIGSDATSSAKFAFTNINSGTPTLKFNQASAFDLFDSTVNSLNIEGGLLSFDTSNSRIGIGNTTPLATLDIAGSASSSGTLTFRGTTDPKINILNGENFGLQFSPGGDAGLTERLTVLNNGNVGIGVTNPSSKLEIAGTSSTISNSAGDLTIDSYSGNVVFGTDDDLIPTLGAGDADLGSLSAYWDNLYADNAYFAGGTTYYINNSGDAVFRDLQVTDTANPGLTVGNGNTGFAKIGSLTISDNNNSFVTFDTNSDNTPEFQIYDTGSATASGDITMGGQLQLGRFENTPTAIGTGTMIFNTTTNTFQCYNGTNWFNCGGTLYSNTNASVADGSYITVTHNLNSSDLLASAWINAQGVWKSLESSYQPAIAWEGKDTEKGLYHNSVNTYSPGNETGTNTDTLNSGLIFDTFEDTTKTDSANSTVNINTDLGDNGSSNYTTLDQRVQDGRVGLTGNLTFNSSSSDYDGQTYLGSNTVNDMYYYDRSKDSSPEVLVELGIDPNWYNGVTLSVATSSAQYSQAGTLADKNPNLTTSYNGSLIKATGTDSTPRTIYITIKSPTTFDWTNYQGDASTGVTITPGSAQTLGDTGVSVTFTATSYNVGDVFKVASWFIEGESSTRGAKQQFPERSYVVATASSVDIIDADTQKLWMRFSLGGTSTSNGNSIGGTSDPITATKFLNGTLYTTNQGTQANSSSLTKFSTDRVEIINFSGLRYYNGSISVRNGGLGNTLFNSSISMINGTVNDVDAAVIPNEPTHEVTVSGWGYIAGDNTNKIYETVYLPYKFNDNPNIVMSFAGSSGTTAPTSVSSCTSVGASVDQAASGTASISTKDFVGYLTKDNSSGTGTFTSTYYYCYTWTATGVVSPRTYTAVGTANGATLINETDGIAADITRSGYTFDSRHVVLVDSPTAKLYVHEDYSGSNGNFVHVYNTLTETDVQVNASPRINVYNATSSIPARLGGDDTQDITSLYVTANTSTVDSDSNTVYIGANNGVTVIQEEYDKGNGADEGNSLNYKASAKYYTKDYISEEMVGDIRGMWPLSSNGSLSMSDVSVKNNTLTNSGTATVISGVRGVGVSFNGSSQYLSHADSADWDFATSFSSSIWVKTTNTNFQYIYRKTQSGVEDKSMAINASGQVTFLLFNTASTIIGNRAINDGEWHHVVGTYDGTTQSIYIDGQLDKSQASSGDIGDGTGSLYIGQNGSNSQYYQGYLDDFTLSASPLNPTEIRNMYQVGYRALQSHTSLLGGGASEYNQQLAGTSTNTIGVVMPDYNNKYMYAATNDTSTGRISRIQLNSDTLIKAYASSGNLPTGGTRPINNDNTSLAVGETLYAVGSATSGVKSMGIDDNAINNSGNYVSKTYALPKNIGSAVLWVSPVKDSSDGSNTITVKASNDGGSNYVTCTLVNTDNNHPVPELEYACTFSSADNDLKVKFEFNRGSTKTNTYIVQYGISWLGETGFRVEQVDDNNVRLYNFSGETQNLKLNVTGATNATLATPWTDAGSYLYPTGYESLRIYDGAGTNYLGLAHDGTNVNFTVNGTTELQLSSTGLNLKDNKLYDDYVTSGISLGDANNTALVGYGASSIIGALNELKNTNTNTSHNDYLSWANHYIAQAEATSTTTNSTLNGLFFDTFADSTKLDSVNSTSSGAIRVSDDSYRVGLTNDQTYSTSTTDNDGQTYLGSNTVNDMYYYDRSKDSSPEVLVELGIDPNWYNGVTLSVATSSAQYSQAGTLADKNPNLTTSYNGSLIKVTGTDSTPRTIYITIKSPTTFDWTNYQGDASTGVTITPGTAQTLGDTGVSVTFTATSYNVGDVFKVASWFIEGESSTRGAKQQFPERSYLVAEDTYVDIIDADTQKLWMRFNGNPGTTELPLMYNYNDGRTNTGIKMLNGHLYVTKTQYGALRIADFSTDSGSLIQTSKYKFPAELSLRNTAFTSWAVVDSSLSLVNYFANDVDAAVIPNEPTHEVTVSGWGYILGSNVGFITEDVQLPYTFNNIPNITVSPGGAYAVASGTPTSLESCNLAIGGSTTATAGTTNSITRNKFTYRQNSNNSTVYSNAYNWCYTWTATGTVSPKQFVAVATGTSSSNGANTTINETDGTKINSFVGSIIGGSAIGWVDKVALSKDGSLYLGYNYDNGAGTHITGITYYHGIHGKPSDVSSWAENYNGGYWINLSPYYPSVLGTSNTNNEITSLAVSSGTSTVQAGSNTLYVGSKSGVSVIQEYQSTGNRTDGLTEANSKSSIKYYTKDYISEEMVGDIRGMWPLNASNTSSDLEDISYKANNLTSTNISSADAVSGVRGEATDFDGSSEYLSRTDTSALQPTNVSAGAWIKSTDTGAENDVIYGSFLSSGSNYVGWKLITDSNGKANAYVGTGTTSYSQSTSNKVVNDNNWHHVLMTYDGTTLKIYVDGELNSAATTVSGNITYDASSSNKRFGIGARLYGAGPTVDNYYAGYIDETFVTATALTPAQIKNMYQVGYRALQSHGTGLGGGSADANQHLGGTTNTVGAIQPDLNNQYMYVGTNNTSTGALSKIQLNSDTNIKTYTSSSNTPTGGSAIIDEDVTSLAVGYQLEAVGSAASGVKSISPDNNSTALTGSLFSKTQTLTSSTKFAYLWASIATDSSDGSSALNVYACNTYATKALCDSNNAWTLGTITKTDSTQSPPEREYNFAFPAAGSYMTFKFDFKRGSTKTSTYLSRYGATWASSVGGADIAERYTSSEPVYPGDIVTIDSPVNDGVATVKKSSVAYDQKVIGVVTTNPGIVMDENLVDLNSSASTRNSPDRPAVALAGRIPVKVTTLGGNISVGDPITTSTIPGVGTRANQAGVIIGKALENFNCDSSSAVPLPDHPGVCQGSVLVFANITHYEPTLYLTDTGDFVFKTNYTNADSNQDTLIATSSNPIVQLVRVLADGTQETVDRIGTFGTVIAGTLKGKSLQTDLISPIASGSAITIEGPVVINPDNSATNSALIVNGTIEAATISARVAQLDEVKTNKLYADEIVADKITANSIDGLDARIASLSAGTTATISDEQLSTITDKIKARIAALTTSEPTAQDIPPATTLAEDNLDATSSASLIASSDLSTVTLATADIDFATVNNYLAVIGTATITDLDVTSHLYTSSISSKSNLLALGANTLLIDQTGSVTINGDLYVSGKILADQASINQLQLGNPQDATSSAIGNLLAVYNEQGQAVATIDASGSANLASLTTELITIASGGDASPSSNLITTNTTSNSTAGVSTLISPNTELTINSPYVTADSLVYLTPTTNTDNKVLFVKAKESCPTSTATCNPSFTVGVDTPASSDISFNWWIIKLQSSNQNTTENP